MLTVAKLESYDMINNPGDDKPCVVLWFTGCTIHCPGCHNQGLWDKSTGLETNVQELYHALYSALDHSKLNTVVMMGGEPLDQDINQLWLLLGKLHSDGYKIWLYTGYELEDIPACILQYVYTIKAGRYNQLLKCDGKLASSNQHYYRRNDDGTWNIIQL